MKKRANRQIIFIFEQICILNSLKFCFTLNLYLIASSESLEKLSLEKLSFKFNFTAAILKNCKTLSVLYLSCCKGLTFDSIQHIVISCDKLTELNLDYTSLCQKSIIFLCKNLTISIEKLSLARLKVTDLDIQGIIKNVLKIIVWITNFLKVLEMILVRSDSV